MQTVLLTGRFCKTVLHQQRKAAGEVLPPSKPLTGLAPPRRLRLGAGNVGTPPANWLRIWRFKHMVMSVYHISTKYNNIYFIAFSVIF